MPQNPDSQIIWTAPEFRYYKKGMSWYLTFGVLAVLLIGYSLLVRDYSQALIFFCLILIILFFSRQTPNLVEISISDKGLKINSLFYPYEHLKYFWIVDNENHKTLNLVTTTFINNHLIVELENMDSDKVGQYLQNHLPRHQSTQETMTQRIMHKFKF